jgi:hypothetical protein
MFTDSDYVNYIDEVEALYRKAMVIYTDLLNELSDQSIRNKLFMLAQENMDFFDFLEDLKKRYFHGKAA